MYFNSKLYDDFFEVRQLEVSRIKMNCSTSLKRQILCKGLEECITYNNKKTEISDNAHLKFGIEVEDGLLIICLLIQLESDGQDE